MERRLYLAAEKTPEDDRDFFWRTAEEAVAYREQFYDDIDYIRSAESQSVHDFHKRLEALPRQDPELAFSVYAALAAHEDEELRMDAATCIDLLYSVNKEDATTLWLRLLDDDNWFVHTSAEEAIEEAVEHGRISEEEAAVLYRAHELAKQRRAIRMGKQTLTLLGGPISTPEDE